MVTTHTWRSKIAVIAKSVYCSLAFEIDDTAKIALNLRFCVASLYLLIISYTTALRFVNSEPVLISLS